MPTLTRNDIALAAIAIACCFGGSHLLVWMAGERLERAQRAEARARHTATNAQQNAQVHTQNMELSHWVHDAVNSIDAGNRNATSAARLYDDYTALANQLGLKPNRIGPTSAHQTAAAPTRNRRSADTATTNQPIAFLAEVDGSIQAITAFLDAIEHDLGHTRIVSARITPVGLLTRPGDQDKNDHALPIRLSLTTLHYQFEPPTVHAALLANAPTEPAP